MARKKVEIQGIEELKGDRELIQKRKSRWKFRMINAFFHFYTKLLLKTCRFVEDNPERFRQDIMFGFWHEDCYPMELVLDRLTKKHKDICAIVTANQRGDYIENTLRLNGGEALRIPDGMEMKTAFKNMLEAAKRPGLIMAAAFDGPSGPYREPKKLLFMLAKESKKPVVYAHFKYCRVLHLKKRWDNYVVPFPFSKIHISYEEIGEITKEKLMRFDSWRGEILY
ncbi:MAG: DUF374 domain-containing protein [Lachnospiraceae bacterium]|nr:DUF374 domain-containing protein [Lachnospiraceae bacterium]